MIFGYCFPTACSLENAGDSIIRDSWFWEKTQVLYDHIKPGSNLCDTCGSRGAFMAN